MAVMKFRGKSFDFSTPKVMGVLNVTPDSFYDGGKIKDDRTLLSQTEKMLSEGADFLDVGGYSSRPGADFVAAEEERRRAIPAIEAILNKFSEAIVSIDTFRAAIASDAIAAGAFMINDISSGDDDPKMFETVSHLKVPYIAMHKQGNSKTMQNKPAYRDVVSEIFEYLNGKVLKLRAQGVQDIVIDPGFGFGKTLEHNYTLLKHLARFKEIGAPILAGVSRKSMIQKVIGTDAAGALFGTVAANVIALQNGADILRVHDCLPARHAIAIVSQVRKMP